ncbi:MAG: phosphoglucomutase [Treponema sp.]|uniref:phosphoglucomutase n=1 Tax=Treponema sp. TaxID=166 RepID=UPI00298D9588|nr:phosphoglucomutase [Treponema sp.]MBR5934249.1 phosphoglucomutase [Treponema sp.]
MTNINHNMILSASGWRKVFAISSDERDETAEIGTENTYISSIAAFVFSEYVKQKTSKKTPAIVIGIDTRPTGPSIANAVIKTLLKEKVLVKYTGIIAAPEIMAYSKLFDGFIYISASHNPVGHNGIKFGLNDGGVLNAQENAVLIDEFNLKCRDASFLEKIEKKYLSINGSELDWVYSESVSTKSEALETYKAFSKKVISSLANIPLQNSFFDKLKENIKTKSIGIVCDMNGSARTLSIDRTFFAENNINFYPFNDTPGKIVHEIIPEPENLVYCARRMEELQKAGTEDAVLGYMPDCDGDRGNIVYWNEKTHKAEILKAQEVFSLSVLAELAFSHWLNCGDKDYKPAVAVNCPTSMRINEIAGCFNAKVFRGEVGEANVVNTARLARKQGYTVRILGEGSNGGTITFPSSVRDPINTIFAFIKLLTIRDEISASAKVKPGLFHIWCSLSGQEEKYKEDFSLCDIMETLPRYTTTGVSEPRAVLKIKTEDHALLKGKFQKVFEKSWNEGASGLLNKYGISSYKCILTNGTTEREEKDDFSKSAKGGLKIELYEKDAENPAAFIWMRGSGTESVFRIMCDVKGDNAEKEKELLEWEIKLILEADK